MACLNEGVRVSDCAITRHPLAHCHGAAVRPSILYFYPHGLLTFWTLASNTSDLSSRVLSLEGRRCREKEIFTRAQRCILYFI
jgi:hypothetical protein